MNMEQIIYRITLFLTGVYLLMLAGHTWLNSHSFSNYVTYYRTRLLSVVWFATFGLGILLHAVFQWRYTWPTAASALTVSYFHIGAICFSWGYTPLLTPSYLTQRIVVRDLSFYAVGLIVYWTVALVWHHAPLLTLCSFCLFFAYAAMVATKFYRTYNLVSSRMMKISIGTVKEFVKWMQVCCDYIVLFGISSVAITALFPTDAWPYTVLLLAGAGMFTFIAYSLHQYGKVVERATKATNEVTKEIH